MPRSITGWRKSAISVLTGLVCLISSPVWAEPVTDLREFFSPEGRRVTEASYPTDETARQMLRAQTAAGVNQFFHRRQLTPTDTQPVVRMNRDTYYSMAVIDVSEGATLTLPEVPDGKYLSLQPVTQDHRVQPMSYDPGTYELATHIGTHMIVIVRLDGTFSEEEAAFYQNQVVLKAGSSQPFRAEPINPESFKRVEVALKAKTPMLLARDGLLALRGGFTAPTDDSRGLFDIDKYQIMAAGGWGGAQWRDNIYEISGGYPMDVCHQATFEDPQNDAFWSFTVYDKAGFMFDDVANVSSNTATANPDGTYTVSFGCDLGAPNNLPTQNESGVFTLAIRHYRPSERVREQGYRLLPFVQPRPNP
ncbi:MAG: DUF1254 domain-containing protein [Pseudomonadota bacterium]